MGSKEELGWLQREYEHKCKIARLELDLARAKRDFEFDQERRNQDKFREEIREYTERAQQELIDLIKRIYGG